MIVTLLTLLILSYSPQGSGPALPELPKVAVDSYGEESRQRIRAAFDLARARPRDATAIGRLGMILHAYEEHEPAEVCYRRARQLQPGLKWVYLLGLIKVQLGQPAEATECFSEAGRLDPAYWPARLRLAESLFAQGRLDESRTVLAALVKEQGESALVQYHLGRVLAAQREFRPAVVAFQRAVELSPFFGAAHYGLALAWRELGGREETARHLRLSQEHRLIRPFLTDRIEQEMQALNLGAASHLRKGVEYESAGRLEEAISEHEKALVINPRYEQVRLNLFTLYARSGQFEKAEAQYQALNELNPNLAESHFNYGVMKAGRQEFVEAGKAFQRCLSINSYHPQAHFNLGRLMEIEQRYDDALEQYRQAVEYEPSYREARYELARMLIYKGRLPAAIETLERALTPADGQTPRYLYALAVACARQGERERARTYMRQARDRAVQFRQSELLVAIERDLKVLETK